MKVIIFRQRPILNIFLRKKDPDFMSVLSSPCNIFLFIYNKQYSMNITMEVFWGEGEIHW